MKVSEVIAELQKLDQDRNIWVEYDGFRIFPPIPDQELDKNGVEFYNCNSKVRAKEGDYIITAG